MLFEMSLEILDLFEILLPLLPPANEVTGK